MLIFDSLKIIFVHMEKCGGTSVEAFFDRHQQLCDLIIGGTVFGEAIQPAYLSRFGIGKHSSAMDIANKIGLDAWNKYYSFTTVRNPFSRLRSMYCFCRERVLESLTVGIPNRGVSADFIKNELNNGRYPDIFPWNWGVGIAFYETMNSQYPYIEFLDHPAFKRSSSTATQLSRISDQNGNILVKRVVKLEEIDHVWPDICREIQLEYRPIRMVNDTSSKYKIPSDVFFSNPDVADRCVERYREDFERLGYSPETYV